MIESEFIFRAEFDTMCLHIATGAAVWLYHCARLVMFEVLLADLNFLTRGGGPHATQAGSSTA